MTSAVIILFTAFCMRLQMNHCYVTSMDDSPFSTYAQCDAAIEWVDKMQWNTYYHTTLHNDDNGPIPKAHWCTERNW